MKIAVFGGSRGLGREVLVQAAAAGHAVRALVRVPARALPEGVEAVEGDALDPAALAATVAGCDAAISTLGPGEGAPPDFSTRTTALLLDALRAARVPRAVVVTGAMVGLPDDQLSFLYRWIRSSASLQPVLADRRASEARWLAADSGVDALIVRPPRLTDGAPRGAPVVGASLFVGVLASIPRVDLAGLLLREATTPTLHHTAVTALGR